MINFILGIVLGVLFASSYLIVYNLGKKKNKNVEVEEISSEEKEKIRKYKEGFANMMNYSIDVAMGRGDK